MAIDKSNTPTWMKVVLIVLAAVFVLGFISVAANPFTLFAPQGPATGTGGTSDQLAAKYGPTVQALDQQLQSAPESYTVIVALGNTYVDWGGELAQQSQNSTTAVAAAIPIWSSARDLFARALKIKAGDAPVEGNYALMLYYLGDVQGAIKAGEQAVKSDPKLLPALLNLGNFYASAGQTEKARAAYEKVIEVGPNTPQAQQAKSEIDKLGQASVPATP